jgi:hypothetical protein
MTLFALTLRAQTPASGYVLRGTVLAFGEGPLHLAIVRRFNAPDGAATNEKGEFLLGDLPRGTQILEIVALGYRPRLIPVAMSDTTSPVSVTLVRMPVILSSVLVSARGDEPRFMVPPSVKVSRRNDRIDPRELAFPDVIGGNALEAFAVLRPGLFSGLLAGDDPTPAGLRAQLYARDVKVQLERDRCVGIRACDIDPLLSVSVNEGPLGSPDILTTLSVRIVREMRYLPPPEAMARFGTLSNRGPVLVVYTK